MPTKKYLHDIDLDQNQLVSPVLHKLSTAPTGAVDGQLYYNTTTKKVYYYNSTTSTWTEVGSNIYNLDGTLTGARVVTMGANNLTFQQGTYGSAGEFIIKGASTNATVVGLKLRPSNTNRYYEMVTATGSQLITWRDDGADNYMNGGSWGWNGATLNNISTIQYGGNLNSLGTGGNYTLSLKSGATANDFGRIVAYTNGASLTEMQSLEFGYYKTSLNSNYQFSNILYNDWGFRIYGTITATSTGGGVYSGLLLNPTINITGNSSGSTFRGIYYNPTLTSTTGLTHIAFENVSGSNFFNSSSGNTYIGYTSAPSSAGLLDVNGTIKSRLSSAGNFIEGIYGASTTFQIGQGGYGTFNGGLTSPKIVFFDQAQIGYSSDGYTLATSINQTGLKTLTFLGDLRFGWQSSVNSVFHFSAHYGTNGTYDTQNIITIATTNGNAIGRSTGAGTNNILNIVPTYNFTGTASGTIRGIYYNPTLTSITGVTHVGFENVTGSNFFNSTSGSTYIGYSSTPSEGYKFQVLGVGNVVFIKGSGTGGYLSVYDSSAIPQPLFRIYSDGAMIVPTANDVLHRIGNLLFKNSTISAYAPITIGSGVDATDPVYFGTKNIYFTATTAGASVPTNFNLPHAPNNGTQEGLLLIKDFTNSGAGSTSVYNAFFSKIFAQTSTGNVTINHFGVNSVFNTTAGTTLSRGFYYNATFTSSVGLSHIAFENVVGNNYFNSSSGSTLIGYASGVASSYKLDVKGAIRGMTQSTTDSHVFTTNQAGGNITFFDIQQSIGTSSFKVSSSGYVTISNVTLVGNTGFNGILSTNATTGISIVGGSANNSISDGQIYLLVSAPVNDYTSTYGLNEQGIFLGGTYNGGQGPSRLVLGPALYYNYIGVATNVWNFTITPASGQVTDGYGSSLILAGGRGRGTGTGGDLIFQTSTGLTTGTTLQTLSSRWYIKYNTGTLSNVASPSASAALQIDSTTQGFLPPRMTGTNAAAIASKVAGLIVYVTDTTGGFSLSGWYGYDGAAWKKLDN